MAALATRTLLRAHGTAAAAVVAAAAGVRPHAARECRRPQVQWRPRGLAASSSSGAAGSPTPPASADATELGADVKTSEHTNEIFSVVLNRSNAAWATSPERTRIIVRDYDVTDEDVERFERVGYFMPSEPMLDADACAALTHEYERIFAGEVDFGAIPPEFEFWLSTVNAHASGSPDVRKVNNSWWINQGMRELVTSKVLGRVAARLLCTPRVSLWHDQAIWKPGVGAGASDSDKDAGNIGFHQDLGFWQASSSSQMVTAFVALQDMTLENGALRTITGSNNWGLIEGSNAFFDKDLEAQRKVFMAAAEGRPWEDVPTEMKRGQVAFHHCLTFHGSGPNLTSKPRLAAAVHMQGNDVRYRAGKWHPNVRELGPYAEDGQRFEGPGFPVMWDELRDAPA